jgi:hypothetical protein
MVVCMRRTLILILGVALFGILAAVVVASQGSDDPVGSTTGTTETTETAERTTTVEDRPQRRGVDISGPCDEAEHANDPRCSGQAPATTAPQAPVQGGVDISGPCDEAEHAADPRCTGAQSGREDNSGPGSANSGRDGDDSGHGRGRGRGRGGDHD